MSKYVNLVVIQCRRTITCFAPFEIAWFFLFFDVGKFAPEEDSYKILMLLEIKKKNKPTNKPQTKTKTKTPTLTKIVQSFVLVLSKYE